MAKKIIQDQKTEKVPLLGVSLGFFILMAILKLAWATLLPITNDEAYYFNWGRSLSWSYFDHPPMVALWMSPGTFIEPLLGSRLVAMIAAFLAIPIFLSLQKGLGIHELKTRVTGAILLFANFMGILYGFIVTPDIPQFFFWLCALHEGVYALKGQEKRWLSAGIFTGLGLLSKYTMVLIGPVFLMGLLKQKGGLKKPWPYLGALLAFLVFLPHIHWNAQNDWLTMRFQLNRGLMHSHDVDTSWSHPLPFLDDKVYDPKGLHLAEPILNLEKPKKVRPKKTAFQKFIKRVENYLGGQLGFFGLFLPLILFLILKQRKADPKDLSSPGFAMMKMGCFFPLGFFFLISWFQKVEANWPVVYLVSAAALLAPYAARYFKWVYILGGVHLLLFALILWHTQKPLSFLHFKNDRLLRETIGYEEIAAYLKQSGLPTFAETYQLAASLSFYQFPGIVAQWPGLTRHSEFIRNDYFHKHSFESLKKSSFALVSSHITPSKVPGFRVEQLRELRVCRDAFQVLASIDYVKKPRCQDPIHRFFVATYSPYESMTP